jgi:hypothetical protein
LPLKRSPFRARMARGKAVITSAPLMRNKGLWRSRIWREGEVGVAVPDYVAVASVLAPMRLRRQ